MSRRTAVASQRFRVGRIVLALAAAAVMTLPVPGTAGLVRPEPAAAAPAQAATPMATGWVTNKFPQGQPACTGVGYPGAIYYDRLDCAFGWVVVSETTPTSVVRLAFITADGVTQATVATTYRSADNGWQFTFQPGAAWPAGPVTLRVAHVDGVDGNFGETELLLNQLGATVGAAAGTYAPGTAIPVTGTTYKIDQIPPVAGEQTTNVGATFALRVVWPDGTVRGPYGPFTAAPGPIPAAGTFSATIPAAATTGLTADASTNFKATVGIEVVDATYADPITGAWGAERAGSGSVTLSVPPTSLLLENSFVSSVGWVKPGEQYPFRVLVKNYTDVARSDAAVTIPAPDGTTFIGATPVGGSGTCSVNGDGSIDWTIGTVAAATGGEPTIKTCVVLARADSLVEDPQIVWKNLSSTATLTYSGGPAALTSTSHGPKVIPPKATFDTARFGDRPFPVVPVDYFDRQHDAAHSGELLSDKINSPSIAGSTFNLYQEMSYGQLFPNGTVPSASIASADWTYGPGFDFSELSPAGTCTGATYSAAAGTAIYPERIIGGWYQLPGDTGYYGSDATGSALVGAQAGVGPLMQIDNGCGPTGKAVFDAAQIADPEIDYSDYDTDKDGVVDFFMMIFVGVGGHGASQTSVPPYDNIWPHSSSLEFGFTNQGPYGQEGYVSDDQLKDLEGRPLYYTSAAATAMTTTVTAFPVYVRVGPYNVNPEDSIDNASVISHEYGHSLGLPDFYTLGTSRATYGDWNLMATDKGQHMDVFSKQELGWLVPRVLGPGLTDVNGWTDSKANTHRIDWQQPDGTPYTLTGADVNNGEGYVAPLPTRFILDPSTFDAAGPGDGASPDHVWWSEAGNDFGCAPGAGHSLDIYLPELADLPAGTPVTVSFKSYWDIEWDYDYGFVLMSTDGGETYTSLASANGYTNPTAVNPQAAACQTRFGNGITGASGSYEAGTQNVDRLTSSYPAGGFLADQYDLSAAVGSPTVLRFSYSSDPGLARPGWFIDDLVITAGSEVIYETDFESSGDPDDARVFSGGCKDGLSVAAQCTAGWRYINAAEGSPADHAYYLELRDRSGFDNDGKGENDRTPIAFSPGLLLVYTDEAHGYGNVGTTDPPAQTPLDSQPQPGNNTPNLNDAAFTAAAGDSHFSDAGAGWTDNYKDPASADGNWHFTWDCLTFDVLSMAGAGNGPDTVPPYDLEADVRFDLGAGCGSYDYGHGGGSGPVNQPPTAVAEARPTTAATGETVTFDAGGSFDDQQAPGELSYAWDLDDNGTFETPGQVVQRSFAVAGTYQATVRVTDAGGLSDLDAVTVTITGVDPCPPFSPTGSYATTFESGSAGWTVDTAVSPLPATVAWQLTPDPLAHSATQSFFSDAATLDVKDDRLVSPPLDLSSQSQLRFWHRYGFEAEFDGGVLEVSIDGGPWVDVLAGGGSFASGGYSGAISDAFGSPIAGRSAWTGPQEGAANDMTEVVVNLGAFAGDDVRVRFRLATDPFGPGALPGVGWWIDDVSVSGLNEASTCSNNPPVAVDDSATTTQDTPVTINVLGNDADPDGDAIAVTGVSQPAHGTVVDNGDGTVTYTPSAGYAGPDGFSYTIGDGRGGSDSGDVAISVTTAGNRPPTAADDTATTQEDLAVTIDVLANDTDPDGDGLTISDFSDPANGSVALDGSQLRYTPDPGFVGGDTFTYDVTDGRGGTDTATVSVTVTEAPNRPPDAMDDQATTTRDTAIRINVVGNDTDPDGDSLTLTSVSNPPNGTAVSNGDGTVTYTPDPGYTGTDTFTYEIGDGRGGTDTATVTVFVNNPSDTAKATGGGWFMTQGQEAHFSFNAQVKHDLAKGKIDYRLADGSIELKGTVQALRVSGPAAGSPAASGSSADLSGSCTLASGGQCTYTVHVEDRAEPGAGWDVFLIRVYDAGGVLIHEASGVLGGGNIQVH